MLLLQCYKYLTQPFPFMSVGSNSSSSITEIWALGGRKVLGKKAFLLVKFLCVCVGSRGARASPFWFLWGARYLRYPPIEEVASCETVAANGWSFVSSLIPRDLINDEVTVD